MMTRSELLQLIVGRARSNGFELRRWYTTRLELPWISTEAAIALLASQRRYYALIFSHDFAQSFWKPGTAISFGVPAQSFQRKMPDGSIRTVERKPFMRRSARPNAWRYHLRQMSLAEEPLRYLRKYLHIEEDLEPEAAKDAGTASLEEKAVRETRPAPSPGKIATKKRAPRPLPTELPAFLKRPYRPGPE